MADKRGGGGKSSLTLPKMGLEYFLVMLKVGRAGGEGGGVQGTTFFEVVLVRATNCFTMSPFQSPPFLYFMTSTLSIHYYGHQFLSVYISLIRTALSLYLFTFLCWGWPLDCICLHLSVVDCPQLYLFTSICWGRPSVCICLHLSVGDDPQFVFVYISLLGTALSLYLFTSLCWGPPSVCFCSHFSVGDVPQFVFVYIYLLWTVLSCICLHLSVGDIPHFVFVYISLLGTSLILYLFTSLCWGHPSFCICLHLYVWDSPQFVFVYIYLLGTALSVFVYISLLWTVLSCMCLHLCVGVNPQFVFVYIYLLGMPSVCICLHLSVSTALSLYLFTSHCWGRP